MPKASLVQDQAHQDLASQVALLLLQLKQQHFLNRCFIYTYIGVGACACAHVFVNFEFLL